MPLETEHVCTIHSVRFGPVSPGLPDKIPLPYDVFHLWSGLRTCCNGVQSRACTIARSSAPNTPRNYIQAKVGVEGH